MQFREEYCAEQLGYLMDRNRSLLVEFDVDDGDYRVSTGIKKKYSSSFRTPFKSFENLRRTCFPNYSSTARSVNK